MPDGVVVYVVSPAARTLAWTVVISEPVITSAFHTLNPAGVVHSALPVPATMWISRSPVATPAWKVRVRASEPVPNTVAVPASVGGVGGGATTGGSHILRLPWYIAESGLTPEYIREVGLSWAMSER